VADDCSLIGFISNNDDSYLQAPLAVVKRATEDLTPVQKLYLPRKQDQARAVGTRRRKILGLPAAPVNTRFDLPEALKTFNNGDRLVMHDSGPDDPKVSHGIHSPLQHTISDSATLSSAHYRLWRHFGALHSDERPINFR